MPEQAAQLDRRSIRHRELVDDRQPRRVTQRGVAGGAPVPIDDHARMISLSEC